MSRQAMSHGHEKRGAISSNCSFDEDSETHVPRCSVAGHPASAADVGSGPPETMSRADLLRTLGGGVALAMTASSLPSTVARAAAPAAPIEPSPGPQHAEYLCLIVLDGGRPDYVTSNLSTLPNVRSLVQRGRWYNRAWVRNLMSISPPSHAVIGTGSFPKNDGGIVNWDWSIHSTGEISSDRAGPGRLSKRLALQSDEGIRHANAFRRHPQEVSE